MSTKFTGNEPSYREGSCNVSGLLVFSFHTIYTGVFSHCEEVPVSTFCLSSVLRREVLRSSEFSVVYGNRTLGPVPRLKRG